MQALIAMTLCGTFLVTIVFIVAMAYIVTKQD